MTMKSNSAPNKTTESGAKPAMKPKVKRLATIKNRDTGKVLARLQYPVRGKKVTIDVEPSVLANKSRLKDRLLDMGASLAVAESADSEKLANQVRCPVIEVTSLSGWYGSTLVTPYGALTSSNIGRTIDFDNASDRRMVRRKFGTFETQLLSALELTSASSYLTIAFLAALMPALAARIDRQNGIGFCFTGQSGSGKSLCAKFAHSLLTRAADTDLEMFNTTDGELAQKAAHFGGLLRTFNDIKSSTSGRKEIGKNLQRLIFVTNSLEVRQSLKNPGKLQAQFSAFLLALEEPISVFYDAAGLKYQHSDACRCPEIPVPPISDGGIFDLIGKTDKNSTEWAISAEGLISSSYGHILPKWASMLSRTNIEKLGEFVKEHESEFLAELNYEGINLRLAKPFALLFATAVVAAKAKFCGLNLMTVKKAVVKALELAVEQMHKTVAVTNAVPSERRDIVAAFKGLNTLPLVTEGQSADPLKCKNGFRRHTGTFKNVRFVTESYLSKQIGNEAFLRRVILPALRKSGHLMTQSSGYTCSVAQVGLGRNRYLRLKKSGLIEAVSEAIDQAGHGI